MMSSSSARKLVSVSSVVLVLALVLLIDHYASAVPIKLHRKPGRTYKMDPIKVLEDSLSSFFF